MRPYRAVLIGCGKIGSEFADDPLMKGDVFTHAEAYAVCPETTLVGICDTNPDKLRQCGERWQVEAQFFSALAMMEEVQPDLVSICTPDDTHYHVMSEILMSAYKPLGILCEKPLAMDLPQARELVELCMRCDVLLSVNYMRRFARNINALRRYLLEGNLGEIQAVNGYYTKGVKHNGSHWFDLLRFLVGEVEWVLGMNTLQEPGIDPTLDVFLGLQNGVLASLRAVRANHFSVFEMEIVGTKGRVQVIDSGYSLRLEQATPSPHYSGFKELALYRYEFGHRKNLALYAVEDLVNSLRIGTQPACTGADGVAALEISWAAYSSAQNQKKISLNE